MSRVTTSVLIILMLANGSATIMAASGLSDDIGVQLNPGIEDKMNSIESTMKDGFEPNTGVVESLQSMLIAFGRLFLVAIEGMWAAPTMLINIGFPTYLVTAFFAPAYLIATMELGSLLIGRQTV